MKISSLYYNPGYYATAAFYDQESNASLSIRLSAEQFQKLEELIASFLPAFCDQGIASLKDAKSSILAIEGPAE